MNPPEPDPPLPESETPPLPVVVPGPSHVPPVECVFVPSFESAPSWPFLMPPAPAPFTEYVAPPPPAATTSRFFSPFAFPRYTADAPPPDPASYEYVVPLCPPPPKVPFFSSDLLEPLFFFPPVKNNNHAQNGHHKKPPNISDTHTHTLSLCYTHSQTLADMDVELCCSLQIVFGVHERPRSTRVSGHCTASCSAPQAQLDSTLTRLPRLGFCGWGGHCTTSEWC